MLHEREQGINSSPMSVMDTPLLLDWDTLADVSEGAKKREGEEEEMDPVKVQGDDWYIQRGE